MTVTEADKQQLAQEWQKIVAQHGASLFAPSRAPADIETEFCKIWPTAESVLNVLKGLLPFPGPLIVGIVIAAGEAAAKQFCHNNAGGKH